jgi:hypothetical protein
MTKIIDPFAAQEGKKGRGYRGRKAAGPGYRLPLSSKIRLFGLDKWI